MSTNAYDSSQKIEYHEPATYFGFYVSGTSWSASAHPFDTAEIRAAWVEGVRGILARDDVNARTVAGLLCLMQFHEAEGEQEGAHFSLTEYLSDDDAALALDPLCTFAGEFDPSTGTLRKPLPAHASPDLFAE